MTDTTKDAVAETVAQTYAEQIAETAARAYDAAAIAAFGEFASLNFPPTPAPSKEE